MLLFCNSQVNLLTIRPITIIINGVGTFKVKLWVK